MSRATPLGRRSTAAFVPPLASFSTRREALRHLRLRKGCRERVTALTGLDGKPRFERDCATIAELCGVVDALGNLHGPARRKDGAAVRQTAPTPTAARNAAGAAIPSRRPPSRNESARPIRLTLTAVAGRIHASRAVEPDVLATLFDTTPEALARSPPSRTGCSGRSSPRPPGHKPGKKPLTPDARAVQGRVSRTRRALSRGIVVDRTQAAKLTLTQAIAACAR